MCKILRLQDFAVPAPLLPHHTDPSYYNVSHIEPERNVQSVIAAHINTGLFPHP